MADDLVSRLRTLQLSSNQTWEIDVCKAMDEAAGEIDRLRKAMQLMVIDYKTQIAGLKMRCRCEENRNGI